MPYSEHGPGHAYADLRRVAAGDLEAWLRRHFEDEPPAQWWVFVFDSLETEMLRESFSGAPPQASFFAAALLDAAGRGWIARPLAAQWVLRFAALARRLRVPQQRLPDLFTPAAAVRHALAAMPLSKHDAIAVARWHNALLDDPADPGPDARTAALQDVEWLLRWVQRIASDGELDDPRLAAEVADWLRVYEAMAPPPDPR